MPHLVLVRHGQSVWNQENRFTGWVDVELTPKGEAEARKAGEKLASYTFECAFTSKLQRAKRTLALIQEVNGWQLPVTEDEALNERMYGDLQGLNKAETAEKFGADQVHIWRRSWDTPPPNGESLKDTADRVLPYYNATILPKLKAGENVLVAAHGNSIRALIMQLEDHTPESILGVEIPTGVPRVFELDLDGKVLSSEFLLAPGEELPAKH